MRVVLFNPQIPQNTGNIVRTCAVTGCSLSLISPLGFDVSEKQLRRAGLDYWLHVQVDLWDSLEERLEELASPFYFFSSHAKRVYTDVDYTANDWLIFGSETEGLPQKFHDRWPDRFLRLPMLPGQRCLNLASTTNTVVYEAWRQQGWPGSADSLNE